MEARARALEVKLRQVSAERATFKVRAEAYQHALHDKIFQSDETEFAKELAKMKQGSSSSQYSNWLNYAQKTLNDLKTKSLKLASWKVIHL